MNSYESPVAIVNEDLSEGVYMASGASSSSDCWTVTAHIHQRPETGRGDYRLQVDATHLNPDFHRSSAVITFVFNNVVTVTNPGGGASVMGDITGSTIELAFDVGTSNPNEHRGWGDFTVVSDAGLELVSVSIRCTGK